MGTFKPSVVDTKVSQITGSKALLADVGLMVQSHERDFQARRSWCCLLAPLTSSSPHRGWSPLL